MLKKKTRNDLRKKRHLRIRKDIIGTAEIPRLSIFRSNCNIFAQLIDDEKGVTLVSASTIEKDNKIKNAGTIEAAKAVGKSLGEKAKKANIKKAVFDRSGYQYHGRVKALADAAREAGLEF